MDKQQKNVERIVAKKVLKDIDKIVHAEDQKEKSEIHWAKIMAGIIFCVLVGLMILNID